MPALSLLTAPVEAVKQLAEHPTVRLPIWVSDQHIHVSTGGLPPAVGATCHTHKPRFQGQGSLSDLQKEKKGCIVRDLCLHALSNKTAKDLVPALWPVLHLLGLIQSRHLADMANCTTQELACCQEPQESG